MAFVISPKPADHHRCFASTEISYTHYSIPTSSRFSTRLGIRPNALLSTHLNLTRTNHPTNNIADSSTPTSDSLYAVRRVRKPVRKPDPFMSLIARHLRHYRLARATQHRLFSHRSNHPNESKSRVNFATQSRAPIQDSDPSRKFPDSASFQNQTFENTNSNPRIARSRRPVPAGDEKHEPRQQGRGSILRPKEAARKVPQGSDPESTLGSLDFDKRFLIQFSTKSSWYGFVLGLNDYTYVIQSRTGNVSTNKAPTQKFGMSCGHVKLKK